jgi:uncharacterized protein YjbI with pentapeptide repeats
MKMCSSLGRVGRLTAVVALAVIPSADSVTSAQSSRDSTSTFAVLAGTAVTCTDSTVTGDVGVSPGTAVTRTSCEISGTVHAGDAVAERAYADFISAYNELRDNPPECDETLTGTLAGQTLLPGVYCVDGTAKTGTLTLDADGDPDAAWTFLVDGDLTGTNFNVVMDGGEDCNVTWWVRDAATLTTSNFVGTILAGAAITVTGGTFSGNTFAQAAVTLTGASVVGCESSAGPGPGPGKDHDACNQGVGNGPEDCDPGNSNHRNPTNDEDGGTPGNPGRKGRK